MSDKDKNQFTLDTEGTGWKARVRRALLGTVDAATLNLFDSDQRGAGQKSSGGEGQEGPGGGSDDEGGAS